MILISATPLNNRPEDIANQVYLFQDSKDSTLEISNLQHFFRKRIDRYKKLRDNPSIKEVQEEVKVIYKDIREKEASPEEILGANETIQDTLGLRLGRATRWDEYGMGR